MSGIFWSAFDRTKLKSHLSMSVERIRLKENKRSNKMKIERRQIAALVSSCGHFAALRAHAARAFPRD